MSVFVLVCVTPPTASLTNSIATPGLPVGGKQRIAAMEAMYVRGYNIRDIKNTMQMMGKCL